MTLTNEQIQALFAFTEKKFVKWYDLQVELVDHLAIKIEEQMTEDKSLSFEKALGNVYEKFGLFGFAHIVKEKENELKKSNNKFLWAEIKQQFRWPNIIRSLAILGMLIILILNFHLKAVYSITISLWLIDIIFFRKFTNFFSQRKTKKHLLITQNLPFASFGISLFYFQTSFTHFFEVFTKPENYSIRQLWIFIALIFTLIIFYIASRNISFTIYAKARKLYPEAFA